MPRKLDLSHVADLDIETNDTSDIKSVVNDLVSNKMMQQPILKEEVNKDMMHGLTHESTHILSPASIHALSPTSIAASTPSIKDMAKWHTEAEQKVYKAMYTETQRQECRELYFSIQTLLTRTGFKNRRTIIAAIQGLIEKRSIQVIVDRPGDHLGRSYLVYSPSEILEVRNQNGIKIHPQTKKRI
jgi:hypothetical protein